MTGLKLSAIILTVLAVAVAGFGCRKKEEAATAETVAEAAEPAAAESTRDERAYAYLDFYLGMPLAEFRAAFGGRAADEGEGRYTYRGYAGREVGLVFSELDGAQYLTALHVRYGEREEGESIVAELEEAFGEPEHDSRWIPGDTDCNDAGTPVRQVSWPGEVDIHLTMSASRNFEEPPPSDVTFRGELRIEDGRERDDPHPWVSARLQREAR